MVEQRKIKNHCSSKLRMVNHFPSNLVCQLSCVLHYIYTIRVNLANSFCNFLYQIGNILSVIGYDIVMFVVVCRIAKGCQMSDGL